MIYDSYYWGMHAIWWLVWVGFLLWIFVLPLIFPISEALGNLHCKYFESDLLPGK
jgi:hypothetical protein